MPNKVSKLLPVVSIVTIASVGATQFHHTDLPPILPAWFGSPTSLLASVFLPEVTIGEPPFKVIALTNKSLTGAIELELDLELDLLELLDLELDLLELLDLLDLELDLLELLDLELELLDFELELDRRELDQLELNVQVIVKVTFPLSPENPSTAIRYVTPALTLNVTKLVLPGPLSSSEAIKVNPETDVPV